MSSERRRSHAAVTRQSQAPPASDHASCTRAPPRRVPAHSLRRLCSLAGVTLMLTREPHSAAQQTNANTNAAHKQAHRNRNDETGCKISNNDRACLVVLCAFSPPFQCLLHGVPTASRAWVRRRSDSGWSESSSPSHMQTPSLDERRHARCCHSSWCVVWSHRAARTRVCHLQWVVASGREPESLRRRPNGRATHTSRREMDPTTDDTDTSCRSCRVSGGCGVHASEYEPSMQDDPADIASNCHLCSRQLRRRCPSGTDSPCEKVRDNDNTRVALNQRMPPA